MTDYLRDGAEIYRRSFAMIRSEAELDGLDPALATVVVRMIHACGMVDLVADVASSPGFCAAARGALRAGKPILCDTAMVASGVTRARLPADNEVVCTLSHPDVPGWPPSSARRAPPRPWSCGVPSWPAPWSSWATPRPRSSACSRWSRPGADRPAAVIGVPVGFIGAAESKAELARHPAALEHLVVHGRRGGSAIAAAAVNALASDAE